MRPAPPQQEDRVPQATRLYTRQNNPEEAAAFRSRHTRPCPVHFIGAWDTVGSLGYLYRNRRFFDTKLSPRVAHACHALAIDERRPKFEPLLWDETRAEPHQTLEQLWFPGAHADVGGGYPKRQLAEIALQWMLKRAEHAGLQIIEDHNPSPNPRAPSTNPGTPGPATPRGWLDLGDRPREVPHEALHASAEARYQTLGYRPALFSR